MSSSYAAFLECAFGQLRRDSRARLGDEARCRDRLLRVPTGALGTLHPGRQAEPARSLGEHLRWDATAG